MRILKWLILLGLVGIVAQAGGCVQTFNPITGMFNCATGAGGVSSVAITGTANEISVTGTCSGASVSCAISIPSNANLPGAPTTTTPVQSDNSLKIPTTSFVQGLIASLNQAVAVQAATVTILPGTPTYNNGTSGVGATLTASSNGALAAIDGYTASVGDRLLISNQASSLQNGVYTLTTLGNGGNPYVLTRATDFNTPAQINTSGAIPTLNGTVNNNVLWVLNVAITAIGTGPNDSINYSIGAGTPFPTLTLTNEGTTGTTINKLVKKSGAPSTAIINNTADTTGALGICLVGCGTTGAAVIGANPGAVYPCVFDGATTAGDWVQISPTINGDCHDSGVPSTSPANALGEVLGTTQTTNAGAGTYSMLWGSLDTILATSTGTPPYTLCPSGCSTTMPGANSTTSYTAATTKQGLAAQAWCFDSGNSPTLVTQTNSGAATLVAGTVTLIFGATVPESCAIITPGNAGNTGNTGATGATGATGPTGPPVGRLISVAFDGDGAALTTGTTAYKVYAWQSCTIQTWSITAIGGTITIDVWKIAAGTAVPTVSNTITASAVPAISTGTALVDQTTLTGWTTAVAAYDIFGFNIKAVSGTTQATLDLLCN